MPVTRKLQSSLAILAILLIFNFSTQTREFDFPSGTNLYKPEKCYNGYTLLPYESGMILLIDMNGEVVHHWNFGTERARLLKNGNIVVMQSRKIIEYDWDGNVVWDYEVPGGPYPDEGYPSPGVIHHDLQRLPNGNTIFIVHEVVPEKFNEKIKDPVRRACRIIGDWFNEVNKNKELVWEWHAHQGLDLNEEPSNLRKVKNSIGLTAIQLTCFREISGTIRAMKSSSRAM